MRERALGWGARRKKWPRVELGTACLVLPVCLVVCFVCVDEREKREEKREEKRRGRGCL